AAALGTTPAPAAGKAPGLGLAPTPAEAGKLPALDTPAAKEPTPRAVAAPSPDVAQKAAALEAKVKDEPAKAAAPKSPDQQLAPTVQAFKHALAGRSPDLAQIQRLATASASPRLFELLGRGLSEGEVKNLVAAARKDKSRQGLLDLLEDQLYPQLSSSPQAAWDAALDEDLVEEAASKAPEKKPAAKAG
ncbi:MAG: hypothetical protein ABIO70_00785, partial [Pseudomonadota bacterium]